MNKDDQRKLSGLVSVQVLQSIIGLFKSQNIATSNNLSSTTVVSAIITSEVALVIVFSFLGFICAYGLWKRQRWAWVTTLAIQIIQILAALDAIKPMFNSIIAATTANQPNTPAISLLPIFVIHFVLSITIVQGLFECRKGFQ
ncbi:hypothetical protein [Acaryochloris sp. IP29b_bin.137]|uniref:hypothetical protein n=1 Tax=Acaryochloris sp. IP29b_bin.137 TaxID=2969217 RepID=UPI002623B7C7|nr:hypothetical protein [Acaryochloris sp. IP29b_bin.137]